MNTIPDRVESATVPEPEVSVFEAFTPLLRNWRTLLRIPFALGAVTAVITLLIPSTYTAVTSFTNESASPTAGGGLASLAGQLGGGLLGSAGAILGAPTSADLFAEVLTSRELLETTLDSKFRDYDSAHPDSLRSLLDLLGITGDTPLKRAGKGARYLEARVSTHVSKKSGIVSLEVELRPAALAADVANRMVELLNRFNLERRQLQSREQRRFAGERLQEAQHELRDAEARQLSFLRANRTYTTSPLLTFEANRLERDVQVKQETYLTLTREYEQARIAEVRDTPLLTIVDRAVPPYKKSSPHRLLLTLGAVVLGGIFEVWRIYAREFQDRVRRSGRTDYEEFVDASARAWSEMKAAFRIGGRRPRKGG